MAWRVVVSPVRDLAKAKGIENPNQLSLRSGVAYGTAYKWWDGFTTRYVDGSVLFALCNLLDCEPKELITGAWVDDE